MKVEIRNNSVILDGYVNVVQRDSRQLPSPRGRFVEQIMPNTFKDALRKNDDVALLFNHNEQRQLGSTKQGNLQLFEDQIGLRGIATVTDPEVVQKAKDGKLQGWSFGFVATEQRWEDAENGLQRRYVSALDLLEVSILDVTPAYIATSIESRGDTEVLVEKRRGATWSKTPKSIDDNEEESDDPTDDPTDDTSDDPEDDPEDDPADDTEVDNDAADEPDNLKPFDEINKRDLLGLEIEILKMRGM